jgi:hypothetical protein
LRQKNRTRLDVPLFVASEHFLRAMASQVLSTIWYASTKNDSHRISENATLSRVNTVLKRVGTRFRLFRENVRRKSKFNAGLESADHIINTSIVATATAHSGLNWPGQSE